MRIALAQIVSTPEPAENLELVADHVRASADSGARLVVFPEATMCCLGAKLEPIAEPLTGPWASAVRGIARDAGVTVIVGMFTPAPGGKVRNTLLATGNGTETSYDKIHLYDTHGFAESDTVAAGSHPVTHTVPGEDGGGDLVVGLATCHDLRYPGLYQRLADAGATLIVTSASWHAGPGKRAQWDVLVRARALDSTSFIAACDQADPTTVGRPAGRAPTGIGASAVVDPLGTVVGQLESEPGLLIADLDHTETATARRAVPVLANRRF